MGSMVKGLFSGGKQRRQQAASEASARASQTVALNRQQQEQAVASAETEASLGRARRTPRGRRLLVGDAGSTLG